MASKYSSFLEANPTFQERVEAFTSGLLTPDPKAIVLWSMERGESYTIGELNRQVKEFVGDRLPICSLGVWSYCKGKGQYQSVLEKFGFITNENAMSTEAVGPFAVEKTPAGADFADAVAARALWLSGKLTSKHRSMLKIFGPPQKKGGAKTRRGFSVYRVVKLLAEQPDQVYRTTDIADLTGVTMGILTLALNSIGPAGIIDYESPSRDIDGRIATGWAQYRLVNEDLLTKDVEELYDEYRQDRPFSYLKAYLRSVLDYIRHHPGAVYSADTLPQVVDVGRDYVSNILSFLKNRGFLESDFEGGVILSKTKANENTRLLWEHLLRPIEAVAHRLDPKDHKGFYDVLDFYQSHPEMRTKHTQRMLAQYQEERVHKDIEAARATDVVLLALPKRTMKLSTIVEKVNATRRSSLSSTTVRCHLDGLIRAGRFEKPKRGHYRRL
jgi:hypothetical protein